MQRAPQMFKLDLGTIILEIECLIMILHWLPVAFRIKSTLSVSSAQRKKPFLLYPGPILPPNREPSLFAYPDFLPTGCLRSPPRPFEACYSVLQSGRAKPFLSDSLHLSPGAAIRAYLSLTLLTPQEGGAEFSVSRRPRKYLLS